MPSPSEDITADRYQQLNERFYAAEPSEYFRMRLFGLLAISGKTDEWLALLQQGIEYEGISAWVSDEAQRDDSDISRYIAVESQVLLHHAAEAALRLILCHVGKPPCPWLVLSTERNPKRFKQKVKSMLLDARRRQCVREDLSSVVLGRSQPARENDTEEWMLASDNIVSFVRVLATRWLGDANLYNAAKHGLAVIPGDAVFQITPEGGSTVRLGQGTSIEFLESTPWDSGRRHWQTTTQWLDVRQSLGLVEVCCALIDSLWTVAKHRYVEPQAEGSVFFPVDFKPEDLRSASSSPARRFSLKLLEERAEPDAKDE